MKKNLNFEKINEIFFIGAGGVFMSALIKHCLNAGKKVSGSDRSKSETVKELLSLGAKIYVGHDENNLKCADAVVYTSAVQEDNPELIKAKELNIPIFKRSEFLAIILKDYKNTVAVSGCHGKTTTTAMITRALIESGLNPTAFIGGADALYGNYVSGKNEYAVTEACEYKKNFLDVKVNVAVITNIDNDHMDSFKDKSDLINSFSEFSLNSAAIVNADDLNSESLISTAALTFGIYNPAFVRAVNVRKGETGYSFTLLVGGEKKFRVNLKTLGKFNVYNALAAFSACILLKVNLSAAKKAIENFTAVMRRTEFLGTYRGKKIYADYAHHPSEIKEVLSVFNKNFLVVFEPHTYSRTARLKKEFVGVLKNRNTVIFKTYPAREKYNREGDGYSLFLSLKKDSEKKVFYAKDIKSLKKIIEKSDADSVAFIGAGDIYYNAKKFFVDKKT